MNYLDEDRIRTEIAAWRRCEIRRALPQPNRQYIPGETWEEKYDRLYREYGRREQFGKTFSKQFDWRKTA